MVNVTYDECEFFLFGLLVRRLIFILALDMIVTIDGTSTVYNIGDLAFVICATALVFIMIPGVGFFYSGLLRRKNALSMIWTSMLSIAVVSFQVCPLHPVSLTFALTRSNSGSSGVTR